MSLVQVLADHFGPQARLAITGCGGKTSLMIALGREYAQRGQSVLLTTTTKLRSPYQMDYECDLVCLDSFDRVPVSGQRVFFAASYEDGRKVCAPDLGLLKQVAKQFDVVLMEADGSRNLPLKYHKPWDPVVPSYATGVIALVGMSALGRPLDENVMFNYEGYEQVTGDINATVDEYTFKALMELPEGICKGFTHPKDVVLFNQCEICTDDELLQFMAFIGQGQLYGSVMEDKVFGGNTWIS